MIKVAVLGIGAAILAAWLKQIKSEVSIWVLLTAAVFLGMYSLMKLEVIIEELAVLQSYVSAYGSYFKLMLKIIGITYLAELSSDLCKDAGANVLADQIELFGKLSILVLCIPIMTSLIKTIDQFVGG